MSALPHNCRRRVLFPFRTRRWFPPLYTSYTLYTAYILSALFAAVPARVDAHPVPFSYLDLRLESDRVDATLVVHIVDLAHDLDLLTPERLLEPAYLAAHVEQIIALLSGRLAIDAGGEVLRGEWSRSMEPLVMRQCVKLSIRYAIASPPGRLGLASQMFPYDPMHRTFVNIYEGDALTQTILEAGHPRFDYFSGTRQGVFAVVGQFIPSGIHHILIGPDHVLFILGLLLLGGTVRKLAVIVTGFTIAHSITLTLAALDLFMPPARLVEPAIALSIVCVGVDNLLVLQKPASRDLRGWMAFVFGLVHGFGFANVLRDMDLPARALGWSLFSFNVGVELGQLAIVIPAAAGLAALRHRREEASRRLALIGSLIVVAAGVFWFAERVFLAPGGR